MSDWSKPTSTSNYSTEFIQQLDSRLKDLAYGLDPTYVTSYTGLPTNSIRWNWSATNPSLDVYNGTSWIASTKTFGITAANAVALKTSRVLSITGHGTLTFPAFDGTSNISAALTLATVNANLASVGTSGDIPVVTFDAQGRATSVSSVAFRNTILAGGSVTSADITLKTGTGDVTLARLQANAAGTLVYLGNGTSAQAISPDTVAATLQNKTINLSNNTLSGTLAELSTMLSDDNIVGLSTTQSITNKTLSTGCSWNGNTLGATYGGTGLTGFAVGDLVYASTTTTLAKLAGVATGNVLISGGVDTAPSWGKVSLTTSVSGVLPAANGGFITDGLTGIMYANNGAATTIATAAQMVATIGTTYVTNASYATTAGSAGSATSATSATSSNGATAKWISAAINGNATTGDITSMQVRNLSGAGADNTAIAAIGFLCQGSYGIHLHLRPDGYFGLGGWSRSAWSWYSDVNGNMVAAGNVTAYSDPRLKENFAIIKNPINILKALDGGTFNWKHGIVHTQGKAGKKDYGVLADQVYSVMPEIVTESIDIEGESYKTVCYEKLVPVLIEAIKELNSRLVNLEGT